MTPATARTATARSAAAPARSPARRTPAAQPRPQLRAVPAPLWRAPLAPFVIVAVALVVAGLLALLMLNTLVAEDSFRVRQLEQQTTALREQEQVLLAQVARLDSPAELAEKAGKLGLVPAGSPAFLELPSGRVRGLPRSAESPRSATQRTKSTGGAAKTAKPAKPPKPRTSGQATKPATTPRKPG